MLHQNALMSSRIIELEELLEVMGKRKARKRKRIQHGGTLEYGVVSARIATEATTALQPSKKARSGNSQQSKGRNNPPSRGLYASG